MKLSKWYLSFAGLFCNTHSVTPSQSRRWMALSYLFSSMPTWFLHCESGSRGCQRSDPVQCRQPSCQGRNSSADFIFVPHCSAHSSISVIFCIWHNSFPSLPLSLQCHNISFFLIQHVKNYFGYFSFIYSLPVALVYVCVCHPTASHCYVMTLASDCTTKD